MDTLFRGKVVQLNESNRKGKLSRWRKALLKKNDRERKRKEKCTTAQMHHLEKVINSIHRKLLDGKTAYEYDTAYNKAA